MCHQYINMWIQIFIKRKGGCNAWRTHAYTVHCLILCSSWQFNWQCLVCPIRMIAQSCIFDSNQLNLMRNKPSMNDNGGTVTQSLVIKLHYMLLQCFSPEMVFFCLLSTAKTNFELLQMNPKSNYTWALISPCQHSNWKEHPWSSIRMLFLRINTLIS